MDSFFLYGNIIVGLLLILIGFKIYNPYKNDEEAETNFYSKFGTLAKVGGILLLLLSGFRILFGIIGNDGWTEQDKALMKRQCIEIAKHRASDINRVEDYCGCTTEQTTLRISKSDYVKYQELPVEEFQDKLEPIVTICNQKFLDI